MVPIKFITPRDNANDRYRKDYLTNLERKESLIHLLPNMDLRVFAWVLLSLGLNQFVLFQDKLS
jgi:hypothetical protein